MRQWGDQHAQRLDALAQRLGAPAAAVVLRRQKLASLEGRLRQALRQGAVTAANAHRQHGARLARAVHERLVREQQAMRAHADRLQALNPRRVLARGFVWVTDAQGHAVQTVAAVRVGDRLRTVWADGVAQVEVRVREADGPTG
jgi:exodeoxyribonuclease VII large subunit